MKEITGANDASTGQNNTIVLRRLPMVRECTFVLPKDRAATSWPIGVVMMVQTPLGNKLYLKWETDDRIVIQGHRAHTVRGNEFLHPGSSVVELRM